MKMRFVAVALAAAVISGEMIQAVPDSRPKEFAQAVNLYEHGMYERAQTIFESISGRSDDMLAKGYLVLCSEKLQTPQYETQMEEYLSSYPYSGLKSRILYQHALNLFDKEDYAAAVKAFSLVSSSEIEKDEVPEYVYKKAYSYFGAGDYSNAEMDFSDVDRMPYSDYTAPSRYALGYINYAQKHFDKAFNWFSKSAKDPRFEQISNYYMLECRFMDKDYRYVVDHGTELYNKVPEERKSHLARIISESYLVLGDTGMAKDYYEKNVADKKVMNRTDYFYAGSVLYAVADYQGAIDKYTQMTDRTDSLGQIANYHIGYCYIQTKNKVAAMGAFKDASRVSFDKDVQEDAYFNYAKLAFDLNHDTSVFNDYLSKYSTVAKNDRIYSYQALTCLYNHDYEGAVAAYDNIDELDDQMKGNYMKANYLRANQLISNGSYRNAVPCLKAASYYSSRQDPLNQLAKYWLAESYYRNDKFQEARDIFTDLYNISALDGQVEGDEIPYDIAYSFFKEGNYSEASKWFDTYLQGNHDMNGKDAAERRADCDFYRKDYRNATAEYEKVTVDFPDENNIYPYYQAAIAYGLMGNKTKKVQMLENVKNAKSTSSFYPEAMYELGRAYMSNQDEDDAIRTFKTLKASTKDSTFIARSLIGLGMISRNRSEYEQALGYYKQVVEKMPSSEYSDDALLAIESIYQTLQEPDKYMDYAESIGKNADKTADEKDNMYFNSVEQIFQTENYPKALVSLQNYVKKYPQGANLAKADFYIAECFRKMDKKEQACDYYTKAINEGGNASFVELAMLNFSDLSYSLEHYKEAFEGYSSLLGEASLSNNKFSAEVGMMRSAFRGHDYQNALKAADKVKTDSKSDADLIREADYVKAKSYLATSDRSQAFVILEHLAKYPATPEGAEAAYLIIQDTYDQGKFDQIEKMVYKFSDSGSRESYWLAKAYIVLGDSFVEKDNITQAKTTYESILKGYVPSKGKSDDVTDLVRMRLQKLSSLN